MEDVLRHLVRGWQGFVGILFTATTQGVKLPPDELERLKLMRNDIEQVIARQEQMD
jgi:hypothetical protein